MFSDLLNDASAEGFKRFLTAHALAAPAIASRIHRQSDLPFSASFNPAPVTALLKRDLKDLGASMPTPALVEGIERPAECIGAAYTLAGSRLGAKVLAKQWRAAPSGERFSSAYLDQEGLFGDWREFCACLEKLDTRSLDRENILNGATAAFRHFQTAFAQAAGPRYDHV